MFDEFDILDFVQVYVKQADTGLPIYIQKPPNNVRENHIWINHLQFIELDYFHKLPININVFYKYHEDSGMVDDEIRTVVRKIRDSIDTISTTNGQYRRAKREFTEPIPDLKEGFYCINIRLLLTTDKN